MSTQTMSNKWQTSDKQLVQYRRLCLIYLKTCLSGDVFRLLLPLCQYNRVHTAMPILSQNVIDMPLLRILILYNLGCFEIFKLDWVTSNNSCLHLSTTIVLKLCHLFLFLLETTMNVNVLFFIFVGSKIFLV